MKKFLALILALLMTMAVVTGCGDKAPADDDGSGDAAVATDTLVVLSSGAFQGTWDPTGNTILSNKHLEWVVFDHLIRKDADGNHVPGMAESWEYLEDGYTLQIKLREGIKFHDGSDFDAEDVAATIAWTTRPESSRYGDWGCKWESEIVDPLTIKIWPSNKMPCAELYDLLYVDAMLSADDVAAGNLNATMNGTGAYKFVKFENETAYLEAFADYWDPANAAKMPYCEYKYVAEPADEANCYRHAPH